MFFPNGLLFWLKRCVQNKLCQYFDSLRQGGGLVRRFSIYRKNRKNIPMLRKKNLEREIRWKNWQKTFSYFSINWYRGGWGVAALVFFYPFFFQKSYQFSFKTGIYPFWVIYFFKDLRLLSIRSYPSASIDRWIKKRKPFLILVQKIQFP